jgi:uncharacterized protein YceH (UPF0502 family)
MGIMVSEVYEALIAAGAPQDKAKAAAEAVPIGEQLSTKQDLDKAVARLETNIAKLETRLEARLARLEVAVFGGGAMGLALLIKLAFFS